MVLEKKITNELSTTCLSINIHITCPLYSTQYASPSSRTSSGITGFAISSPIPIASASSLRLPPFSPTGRSDSSPRYSSSLENKDRVRLAGGTEE